MGCNSAKSELRQLKLDTVVTESRVILCTKREMGGNTFCILHKNEWGLEILGVGGGGGSKHEK